MVKRDIAELLRRVADRIHRAPGASVARVSAPTTLYLYFDEAGDLDFGPHGSRFFLCGILALHDPWPLTGAINDLRERLYRGKMIIESFHASEDLQETRNEMFDCLSKTGGFEQFAVAVSKNSVPVDYREASSFYTLVADLVLRNAVNHYPGAQDLFVITDRLPVKKKRDSVIKGFKNCLADVADGRQYHIGHHSCAAHPCLQAADYMNWAIFRKWERRDFRSYDTVRTFIRQEMHFDGKVLAKK